MRCSPGGHRHVTDQRRQGNCSNSRIKKRTDHASTGTRGPTRETNGQGHTSDCPPCETGPLSTGHGNRGQDWGGVGPGGACAHDQS